VFELGFFRHDHWREFPPCLVRVALTMENWPNDKQIRLVDELLAAGFSVLPALRTRVGAGRAPADMDMRHQLEAGGVYSRRYWEWCRDIQQTWPSISLVLIENEINDPLPDGGDWAGTVDEYIRLCITAKTVFPKVADGGLQPKALFWCSGWGRPEYQDFECKHVGLKRYMEIKEAAEQDPRVIRCKEFLEADFHQWVDVANFNYAHGFDVMNLIVQFLRACANRKPVMCGGFGCAAPYAELSPEAEIERREALLRELGVSPRILISLDGKKDDRFVTALVDSEGRLKKKNAAAFRRLLEGGGM
jgi:hypothetical protein